MEEQDINFTDDAFALNTEKNARQCEPSRTSFFRLDKNYRPREYDKTNKVLPLIQTENISAGMNGTLHPCDICNERYKSQSGLKCHRKNCTQPTRDGIVDINSPMENTSVENNQQQITSRFKWGRYKEAQFVNMLNAVYDKVVFWRKNIFLLPSGKSGKQYIEETTRLINSWIQNLPLQDVAFKAIMVMPNVLLQKPARNSKSKDHLEALNGRLNLWKEGELTELLIEGETIQKSLSGSKSIKTIAELWTKFKNYIKKGNISAAVKLLTNNMHDGILPLDSETLNKLKKNIRNQKMLTTIFY